MTVAPEVYAVELSDHEYEIPCCAPGCATADWVIWASHSGDECGSKEAFLCDSHKEWVENGWIDAIANWAPCWRCKFSFAGQLSDHFKAIRL